MSLPQGLAHNQVTLAATATLIANARPDRKSITVVLKGAAPQETFVGGLGVTTANGVPVPAVQGASITIETAAAVYGIVAATTQDVGYYETF